MNALKSLTLLTCLTASLASKGALIDDYYPSCVPDGASIACQGRSYFPSFPGRYTVHLKIGDRTFKDGLEIKYITRHPGMASAGGEVVSGYFSVPSANFYGPIIHGKIANTYQAIGGDYEMSFHIRMRENGKTFPVYFHVKGPNSLNACDNTGAAYLDEARTKLLGTFTMTKDNGECTCGHL